MNYLFLGLISIAVFFEVVADIAFKQWTKQAHLSLFTIGMLLYIVGTAFWAYSLRHELLSRAITVFTVTNLIAVVLVGVLIFNERLTIYNKIGIGLGIMSIIFVEFF